MLPNCFWQRETDYVLPAIFVDQAVEIFSGKLGKEAVETSTLT
jgi:hypothetical protein